MKWVNTLQEKGGFGVVVFFTNNGISISSNFIKIRVFCCLKWKFLGVCIKLFANYNIASTIWQQVGPIFRQPIVYSSVSRACTNLVSLQLCSPFLRIIATVIGPTSPRPRYVLHNEIIVHLFYFISIYVFTLQLYRPSKEIVQGKQKLKTSVMLKTCVGEKYSQTKGA